ncbi:tetraacyldisaccharide 4'-kinase [uncultured Xylophilus sp.]|uniref:tetraacyldisaccharide 4'-kinase n=1 Tax=uncultured Xylophilus sp. TaxID=296832 RepID=UPI0025FC284B|nr:tetraacyldisaccharide 4'-kinase [uncultured Xylophilus sp.]
MTGLRAAAAHRLQQAWLGRGLLTWALRPVSLLYCIVWSIRGWLYRIGINRSERLPVPVIVVGNVVAGGAGKTPTVIALVEHLRARGLQVGIVSRGYGGRASRSEAAYEVRPDSDPSDTGDEPLLLRRRAGAPVFVGRRRVDAGRALLAAHPGVQAIVCDDGLQHAALARDIEICVFDDRGVGNGLMLPAGPLREPWPSAVDVVLHTGARPAFAGGFSADRRLQDHAVRADGTACPLATLGADGPVVAVAGIASPESFFSMLRERGVHLDETVPLPDHYDFDSWSRTPHQRETLICTEKDAAKLWRRAPQAWAVGLSFAPEPAFFATVDRLLDARLSSAARPSSPPISPDA